MRSFVLGLVILAVPAYATGQERDRPPEEKPDVAASSRRGHWTGTPTLPPHPASIPFPNIGPRPFPNVGPQPLPNLQHRGVVQPHGDSERRSRRPHSRANVVFVPYASPVIIEREVIVEREVFDQRAAAPVIVARPLVSRLILDIHPPTAQVFADGYYIGIPEDFRLEDGGAVLEPGPHRIDILARDYEPVSFDVNLARGQSATFRHYLTPIVPVPQPRPDTASTPPAVRKPTTFYLIRGCYMGNVPPKEANLPPTCDISRAVSFQY